MRFMTIIQLKEKAVNEKQSVEITWIQMMRHIMKYKGFISAFQKQIR